MRAYIVVDLGFGDSGKGLLTDFLSRHFDAGFVVRYNGGAQAGHNVIAPDGRHHTFSQFGSGTFIPGVKTYLSRHVVIHPAALLVEGDILAEKGIEDIYSRLRLSEQALIITPFHQAANHIREMMRAANRHGSCGVGVGEVVEDARLNLEDSILAGDLYHPKGLRRKLHSVRERKRAELAELCGAKLPGELFAREWEIFEREDVMDTWMATISRIAGLGLVTPDSVLHGWLQKGGPVIFEGAQGVLLDADAGFHPYTTWSCCTAANAHEIIHEMAPDSEVFKIGVMRSYAVRHGPGPLPTETDELTPVVSEHNRYNEWQGAVRYGWFDAVLTRYALGVVGGLDSLAVTHLDLLSHLKTWQYCAGYGGHLDFDPSFVATNSSNGVLKNFNLPRSLPLEQREQFTRALCAVTPDLQNCDANSGKVIHRIETLLGQQVGMISSGPRAENVKISNSFPSFPISPATLR